MDFVPTCVDGSFSGENLRIKLASRCGSSPRGFQSVHHSRPDRFGEGSSFKTMSTSSGMGRSSWKRESSQNKKSGSASRKDSVSSRFMQKRSRRASGDVLDDLAEAVSGPSSITLGTDNEKAKPEHLVVLVNGINGSALNWKFAAEQFKLKLADKVVVHCSATNSSLKTFNGVDVMGKRLAQEFLIATTRKYSEGNLVMCTWVMEVIEKNPGVTKISVVGHSLGGLISRYAIGRLYAPPGGRSLLEEEAETSTTGSEVGGRGRNQNIAASTYHEKATIARLEPINFITLATPHLGSRDNRHLPFLFGLGLLERVAPFVSHWFVGRTGKHLFLADGTRERQPLLERMVTDCEEGKFLSALRCFKKRTAYANVCYDHMVGWRTSSIRKQAEMPENIHEVIDSKYPHIVREEYVSEPEDVPAIDGLEEVMVTGLQNVPWWRVDVNFSKAKPYFAAHNLIQVKNPSSHKEGADVIHHIIDKHF